MRIYNRILMGSPAFLVNRYWADMNSETVQIYMYECDLERQKRLLMENEFRLVDNYRFYMKHSDTDLNRVRVLRGKRSLGWDEKMYSLILPISECSGVVQMCAWCGASLTCNNLYWQSPVVNDDLWNTMCESIGYMKPEEVPLGTLCCTKCIKSFLGHDIREGDLKDVPENKMFLWHREQVLAERAERKRLKKPEKEKCDESKEGEG